MLRHVVMWKMNKKFTSDQKFEKALEIKQALEALKDKIDEIIDIEVGISGTIGTSCCCKGDKGEYDICLVSSFENTDALDAYAQHPEHLKVVDLVKSCVSKRKAVDYLV